MNTGFPFFLQRPDLVCPHCGAVGIAWSDKREIASRGGRCECRHCGQYCHEARLPRLLCSLALYGLLCALVLAAGALAAIMPDMLQNGFALAAGLVIAILLWFGLRRGFGDYTVRLVPLVAITPSPRWELAKDMAGVLLTALLVIGLMVAFIIEIAAWLRKILGL